MVKKNKTKKQLATTEHKHAKGQKRKVRRSIFQKGNFPYSKEMKASYRTLASIAL